MGRNNIKELVGIENPNAFSLLKWISNAIFTANFMTLCQSWYCICIVAFQFCVTNDILFTSHITTYGKN